MKISINSHSSIQVDDMFFDPYNIDDKAINVFDTNLKKVTGQTILTEGKKAKYVFLTHTHYDHLSPKDMAKILDDNTVIIATPDAENELDKNFPNNNKFFIRPNESMELDGITVTTLMAYNKIKPFHNKKSGWLGYKVTKKGETFAVLGDTDATPELENLECDILFIPIGGIYTMNAKQAAELTNKIAPKIAIPSHYGSLVGTKKDEQNFIKNVDKSIFVQPLVIL